VLFFYFSYVNIFTFSTIFEFFCPSPFLLFLLIDKMFILVTIIDNITLRKNVKFLKINFIKVLGICNLADRSIIPFPCNSLEITFKYLMTRMYCNCHNLDKFYYRHFTVVEILLIIIPYLYRYFFSS